MLTIVKMDTRDPHVFCRKKAFEMSYALFRSADLSKNSRFGRHLQDQALDLLGAATLGEYEKAATILNASYNFIRLGSELSLLNHTYSEVILREIKILNSAILDCQSSAMLPNQDIDIESIFSKDDQKEGNLDSANELLDQVLKGETDDSATVAEQTNTDSAMIAEYNSLPSSEDLLAIRQATILEKMKEYGKCRLKDLQENFPHVSERTIRYDLQRLVERGFIDKIGQSGPSTYYVVREARTAEKPKEEVVGLLGSAARNF